MKTDAAVVPVFTWPLGGGRYRLQFETPILAEEFGAIADGREERVRRATALHGRDRESGARRSRCLALDAQPLADEAGEGQSPRSKV
jgi:hypothetical protein